MMVLGGTAEVVWKASGDVVQLHEVALLDHTIKLGQLSGSPIAHGGARGAWTGPMCARSAEPRCKTLNEEVVGSWTVEIVRRRATHVSPSITEKWHTAFVLDHPR